MNVGVWCKLYDLNNCIVYDIFDVELDSGEVCGNVFWKILLKYLLINGY